MVIGRLIDFNNLMNVTLATWQETIVDVVLLIFLLGITYYLWKEIRKVKEQRAETRLVQKAIKTPGGGRTAAGVWAVLKKVRDQFRTLEAGEEAGEKKIRETERKREAITQEREKEAKKIPSKLGKEEAKELKMEERAEKEEEKSAKKIERAEERELEEEQLTSQEEQAEAAIVAGAEDIVGEGEKIAAEESETLVQEEAEKKEFAAVMEKLESFRELNSATLKYLFGVLQQAKPLIEKSVRTEEESLAGMESQHEQLKSIINDLRTIIGSALPLTRSAKKNPKQMVQNLKKVIEAARKEREDYAEELQQETKHQKEEQNEKQREDKITELQKKINLFDENMPLLKELQRSIEEAEKFLFQQINELRNAQTAAKRISSSLRRTEKRVDSIKKPREVVKELTNSKTSLLEAIDRMEAGSNVLPLTVSVLELFMKFVQTVKKVLASKPSPQEFYTAVVPLFDSIQETLTKIQKIEHIEQTMVELLEKSQIVLGRAFHDEVSGQLEALAGGLKKESLLVEYEEKLNDKLLAALQQAKTGLLAAIRKLEENKQKTTQTAAAVEVLNATAKRVVIDSLVPLLRKKMELKAEYKEKAEEFTGRINQAGGSDLNEKIGI